MIMRFLLMTGLFILLQTWSFTQNNYEGRVIVIQDQLVDTLLQQYDSLRFKIMENPDNKAIPGYRIQIFFDSGTNSSDRAKLARDEFMLLFPDIQAYVNWKAPNYRVRVGDFRTRLEAEKVLQTIIADYPNAWVIKDEINFPLMN
jgi:hypothetical protein